VAPCGARAPQKKRRNEKSEREYVREKLGGWASNGLRRQECIWGMRIVHAILMYSLFLIVWARRKEILIDHMEYFCCYNCKYPSLSLV
jgi:hypothetical protein